MIRFIRTEKFATDVTTRVDMSVFDGSPQYQAYVIISFVGTVLSSIASMITILLINKMKVTGYIKLILTMTWFQFVYDVSFFNGTVNVGTYWVSYVANVWQLVGGIGSSLISNWIAFVVLYVVYNKRSIDIVGNYEYMLASAIIPSFAIVIVYSIGAIPEGHDQHLKDIANLGLYYYIRLVSIFLNFIMFGMASYYNHLIRSKGFGKSPAEQAINTLCHRLMYYPLLQAISRSGFAWYEFQYGFNFDVENCQGNALCYTALLYATVITPTVSFGYLALFVAIEPHAYCHFRKLFGLSLMHREREQGKDTFSKADGAGSVEDGRPATDRPLNANSEADNKTDETLSTNGYAARESSLYHHQQQHQHSSIHWGNTASSVFRRDAEEADLRDEAALLESINSEVADAPPSFSLAAGLSIASLARISLPRSQTPAVSLESSTKSPIATIGGFRDSELDASL